MGKAEDEQPLPSTTLDAQSATPNAGNCNGCCLGCSRLRKVVTLRCIFVLVLSVAVLLSAVFWLPFFHFGDQKDLDLDYAGRDIVASFKIKKPASFLEDYVIQLENDIFEEISFPTTKVEIISFAPAGSNTTKVVFAVESDATTQSLIRASFVSLVTHQNYLHLTPFLFGDPSSFEVLKFKGGITASPDQKAFLMQKVQIVFNFTLNFSIEQILYNFNELTSQLKSGLHLAPYEPDKSERFNSGSTHYGSVSSSLCSGN
ncbi:hydroxyproline-rich glycoprotein family protein [Forsythia ovata]|uniref:Hydroxyproline-rich glycoprotein family protein n=1 Tax=Forsythia ovata TaxID=205694 RepID=A0ABD1SP49_9LAMI